MLVEISSTSKERFPNAFLKWKKWSEINKDKSKLLHLEKVHTKWTSSKTVHRESMNREEYKSKE